VNPGITCQRHGGPEHRWAELARYVFGVTEADDAKAAKALSGAVAEWLDSIGMCYTFAKMNTGSKKAEQMIDDIFRMYGQAVFDRAVAA